MEVFTVIVTLITSCSTGFPQREEVELVVTKMFVQVTVGSSILTKS